MMRQGVNLLFATGLAMLLTAALASDELVGQQEKTGKQQQSEAQDKARSKAAAENRDVGERPGTPVLGIVVVEAQDGKSANVVRVWPGSAAEQAGFMAGDRIVKIGETEVDSPEAVRSAVMEHEPGERVDVEVSRDGQSKTLQVRLSGADGLHGWIRRGAIPEMAAASGWLGVRVAPGPSADMRGVLVTGVLMGSPADTAGIKKDDQILRVNKTRVEAAADLKDAIAGHRPGETVNVTVRRDGEQKSLKARLGSIAYWHGELAQLDDDDARQLLNELIAAPFALAEDLLPNDFEGKQRLKEAVHLPQAGVAPLNPTKGNDVHGTIVLHQRADGLHFSGEIKGLKPGLHGFHIHEFGDSRAGDGKSAGGHFNPRGTHHGGPKADSHHAGDLGNIEANKDGVAQVNIVAPWLKLHFVVGRSIVVHGGEDDLTSQPSGDAGSRVAVGVIGVADPSAENPSVAANVSE